MQRERSPRRGEQRDDAMEGPNNNTEEAEENFQRGPVDNSVATLASVKLPPFWKNEPELWFIQADARFHTKRIRSDDTKYYTVVAALDSEVLHQISDVIRAPPDKDKYEDLKGKLIGRFTESQERRLHRLLTDLELGDKKPTQLLREMQSLAGGKVSEDLLRSLWMKRMPTNVRCVLSASRDVALTPLADLADRILENSTSSFVMATSTEKIGTTHSEAKSIEERVSALEKGLMELLAARKESTGSDRRYRGRSRSSKDNTRSRSKSPTSTSDSCYYHRRYGSEAKHCTKPCSFSLPMKQEN